MKIIYEPWPWYVGGPLIAIVMFLLLFAGKKFGMSSNLRTVCAAMGADSVTGYFDYKWKSKRWNLMVVLGAIIGGFIASHYMGNSSVEINPLIAQQLAEDFKIKSAGESYMPPEIFSTSALSDPFNVAVLLIGGILVGFGARYGGGCTSGHGVSGLSNLQLPSFIAVIGFFIGGIIMVHFIYPLIFT
ncbi:hypothetical protein EV196_10240 [Mariniflexile fucanivorans]|uniref:Sulphur transport domain-containing protein n=1 Tax=Mariniflexile fucanivorans TaxID=264023 RepID=A0A4R1RMQ8_9FLAO|nr:YeeE/YedE thiosulfate transporter family protein [Mariniflexile fucanivorans]TCL67484.1 hypothetical protein EV196_10240 [Mariniflexile fucanivorans]